MNPPPRGFALTDLQQAYWIGEQDAFRLSTPAFVYQRLFARQIDVRRMEAALLHVLRAHPMLRTRIAADGTQSIGPVPERVQIPKTDLRRFTETEEQSFVQHRQQVAASLLPPLEAGIKIACLVDHGRGGDHVHFLLRLVALDARSAGLFFEEAMRAYFAPALAATAAALGRFTSMVRSGGQAVAEPETAYERFVRQQAEAKGTPAHQKSLDYWRGRMATLPGAPELPFVDVEALPRRSAFVRRQLRLDATQTAALAAQARRLGLSLTVLVCTAYADVLRRWARNPAFTLNLLASQRPETPEFARVLGNFSNTMLLEVPVVDSGFRERALALQQQLGRDIAHARVSAIELTRSTRRISEGLPATPVVFASMLGYERKSSGPRPDMGIEVRAGAMHTPQVLLDHQAFMDQGEMVLNWDAVEGAFLPGVVAQMFETYGAYLQALQGPQAQDLPLPVLPAALFSAREQANRSERALPRGLLQDPIARACQAHAGRLAVVDAERSLRYAELWALCTGMAAQLRAAGVGPNDLVAILAPRGWRQVAAAVAVLLAGGAYLPVSVDLPPARQAQLFGQPGVKVVAAHAQALQGLQLPGQVMGLALEQALPDQVPAAPVVLPTLQGEDDLAYVIFTSGSTGTPKGVAITHRGAVNTVQDVMARFGLSADDRVLGLSAFNFDLSVYDIFGTLGVGACLVLPPHTEHPAPDAWAAAVRAHQVTVWNSVPALLEMQIEFLGAAAPVSLASLRLVMLSGDWIPVSLPGRLKSAVPGCTLVSLGGATEASIWSNYFVVEQVDPAWKSIPYGWPLSNQQFHVLDAQLQAVPTWVVGELYIGGVGLAKEYHHDPVRTAERFIVHPGTGQRLYRTGDLGRYHPSGHLEFLGRNDSQVKIRGFRIELGEINAAMERCAGVAGAVSTVRDVAGQDRQLAGFYVPDRQAAKPATPEDLRAHLARLLPDYMVPGLLLAIERMPVTANGKVDQALLAQWALGAQDSADERVAPRDARERRLAALWSTLLGVPEPGVHDNFFALGGSSLLAVRLLGLIEAEFQQRPDLASMLRHATIASQAALLCQPAALQGQARAALVPIREGAGPLLVLVHPVGGNVLCYRELIGLVPAHYAIVCLQSPADGSPRTLSQLAADHTQALRPWLRPGLELHLMGWSMGGVVADEMARLLQDGGTPVQRLTLVESWGPAREHTAGQRLEGRALLRNFINDVLDGALAPQEATQAEADDEPLSTAQLAEQGAQLLREAGSNAGALPVDELALLLAEHGANFNALMQHRPGGVDVPTLQFRGTRAQGFPFLEPFVPRLGRTQAVSTVALDEDHFSILKGDALRCVVQHMLAPESHTLQAQAEVLRA